MNPVQCRMARGALDWTSRRLASAAGITVDVVNRFQTGQPVYPKDAALMRKACEAAGITFVDDDGEGPGVRLKKRQLNGDRAESIKTFHV